MRAIIMLTSLLLLSGCATLTRSKVGPQVLAAYPYANPALGLLLGPRTSPAVRLDRLMLDPADAEPGSP